MVGQYLKVEGSAHSGTTSIPTSSQATPQYTAGRYSSLSRVNPPTCSRKSETRYNIKVVKAQLRRDNDQKPILIVLAEQEFVSVTESTANVPYINSVLQSKFGADFVVVTSDGLKVEDSSSTQGNTS